MIQTNLREIRSKYQKALVQVTIRKTQLERLARNGNLNLGKTNSIENRLIDVKVNKKNMTGSKATFKVILLRNI